MGAATPILRLARRSLARCAFLLLLAFRPMVVPLLRLAGRLLLVSSSLAFACLYLAARSATISDDAPSPYWFGGGLFGLALAAFVVADGYDTLVLALCPKDRIIVLN